MNVITKAHQVRDLIKDAQVLTGNYPLRFFPADRLSTKQGLEIGWDGTVFQLRANPEQGFRTVEEPVIEALAQEWGGLLAGGICHG